MNKTKLKASKNSISDQVKNHFNRNANNWRDLYNDFSNAGNHILINRKNISIEFLSQYLKPGSYIIDVGCGSGIVALEAVNKGYYINGIDFSPYMIQLSKETFLKKNIDKSKYQFSVGDLLKMKIPANSCDGILALGFIEYQKDELEVLNYFNSILKPGGILICSGPIKIRISNFFGFDLLIKLILYNILNKSKPVTIHKYNIKKFRKLFISSGFKLIDYKRHGYSDFMILKKIIGLKGELLLNHLFEKLSTILPVDRFANDIIVVGKKGFS